MRTVATGAARMRLSRRRRARGLRRKIVAIRRYVRESRTYPTKDRRRSSHVSVKWSDYHERSSPFVAGRGGPLSPSRWARAPRARGGRADVAAPPRPPGRRRTRRAKGRLSGSVRPDRPRNKVWDAGLRFYRAAPPRQGGLFKVGQSRPTTKRGLPRARFYRAASPRRGVRSGFLRGPPGAAPCSDARYRPATPAAPFHRRSSNTPLRAPDRRRPSQNAGGD